MPGDSESAGGLWDDRQYSAGFVERVGGIPHPLFVRVASKGLTGSSVKERERKSAFPFWEWTEPSGFFSFVAVMKSFDKGLAGLGMIQGSAAAGSGSEAWAWAAAAA
jgi:hypothetical protein